MKKALFLLAIASLFMASCGKAEQPQPSTTTLSVTKGMNIVGTVWEFTNKTEDCVHISFTSPTKIEYSYSAAGVERGSAWGIYEEVGTGEWSVTMTVPDGQSFMGTGALPITRAWITANKTLKIQMERGSAPSYIELSRIK